MTFHKHSPIDYLFVLGQCQLYCHNSLRKCQNLLEYNNGSIDFKFSARLNGRNAV